MTASTRPPERANGLLAMLSTKGLVRQSEVAVTQSIAWLCGLVEGGNPLDKLIRSTGLECGANPMWRAEVLAPDRTRTDLECWWGDDPRPHVVIEAKLAEELTEVQVRAYLLHLEQRRDGHLDDALIGILVPEYRRIEAERVLSAVIGSQATGARSVVWSYDEVLVAIESGLGASPDLEQLRGFIQACEALDISPFSEAELADTAAPRQRDLVALADRATAAVHPAGARLLPGSRGEDYEWRRYLEVTPGGTNIAVGLRLPTPGEIAGPGSRLWLRVHRGTVDAAEASRNLREAYPHTAAIDENTGHTWLPLVIPTGEAGAVMVSSIVEQIDTAIRTISAEV